MVNVARAWSQRTRWIVAGAFVACWVGGLSVGGPTLEAASNASDVENEFAGSIQILVFALLVHGIAAGLLVALGRCLPSAYAPRTPLTLASIAAAFSLIQLGGEILLVTAPEHISTASVWDTISRVDGAKMLVLAGVIAIVALGTGEPFRRHLALTVSSAVSALALLTSGVGYLTSIPALMTTATASLPLLLLWVLVAVHSTRPSVRGERPLDLHPPGAASLPA